MTDAANNLKANMNLDTSTLAEAEHALREQLRPIARAALRGAIADVLAEGLPPEAIAAVTASLTPQPAQDQPEATEHHRRVRRSPEELARLTKEFVDYVAANPGCKAPELAKHLGCSIEGMRSVQSAVKATGKVAVKGTKVHTTYWPEVNGPKSRTRKSTAVAA